ncbi:hypothetical protein [Nocardioides sp.]|uniref:hypothetical protein n=1 Tax=Nocardioides sp. TaxID=35761 RepID=UPI001A246950|nr:hypothetical protein [Nocardioides sp.]MBJ7357028.1 hypothetical protein [Nocardioides sp.]
MGDDKLPTQDAEALGEMPDAEIEPREPNPGGADALPQEEQVEPADLDPEKNPAVDAAEAPAVLREGEDTDTEATKDDADSQDVDPQDESPA